VDTLFLLLPNPLPLGRVVILLMLPAEEAWRISLVKAYLPKCLEGKFIEVRRCWGARRRGY
jgi:hypothetical protein